MLAKSAEEKSRLEKLSETEILAEAKKLYGDKAEKVIAEYKNAYPEKEVYNALFIDTMIRLPILKITAAKADQKSGDVYSYIFGYGSPFSFLSVTHGGSRSAGIEREIAAAEQKATVSKNMLILSCSDTAKSEQKIKDWARGL